ncbi:MAG: helix-turn-helix transcriptional regulator [Chloroflexi bacterium]|nr:helix-turn-helix transcriptional regulator [Chloroflexota bacterium]
MTTPKEDFSAKLNRLFEEKRKPDGTPYTPSEVVESSKGVIARVYLWKLRNGRASNPSFQVVQALTAFFGVDPSYFFESNAPKPAASQLPPKRDKWVEQVALRSAGLDDDEKKAVLYMIESISKSKKHK